MSKYIIIDSGMLGNTLQERLGFADIMLIDNTQKSVLGIAEFAASKCKDNNSAIIFLNADAEINDINDNILDIVLWLRCKHKSLNPIVIYSIYSLEKLLQKNPTNYFIISPGCVFKEDIDVLHNIEEIKKLQPITSLMELKPFLKPRVDEILALYKHRMANYAGMALMLDIVKQVYSKDDINIPDTKILKGNFPDFFAHRKSLYHALLSTYFDFEKLKITDDQKKELSRCNKKKILLVDDLADKGWQPIISQMIYGEPDAKEIKSLEIKVNNDRNKFDFEATKKVLEDEIQSHKPHLILLDLRLSDETGEINTTQLSGYNLLVFLKSSPQYKGVPVIMFTASNNAETIKTILNAGAEAVWTKPGIDEGLSVEDIIKRYDQLLKLTDKVFSDIDTSKFSSLNNSEKIVRGFEEMRNDLLSAAEYIKFRCELLDLKKQNHYFNGFTDIFIDTNYFMSGFNNGDGSEDSIDFAKTILNVYKLVLICRPFKHTIQTGIQIRTVTEPRVIIINNVWDELLEHSKIVARKYYNHRSWQRALLSYSIFRSLFGKYIRTEFNQDLKPELNYIIAGTRKDADTPIIENIINIISGQSFQIPTGNTLKYTTHNTNVLLLTNEQDSGKESENKIPKRLNTEYEKITAPKGNYTILRLKDFNEKINEIKL